MAPAFAELSVWEQAKASSFTVTGKVVSIATDEEKILVRISDGKNTETYKVCTVYPGGDGLSLAENERIQSLREAFRHGDTIHASYTSPFDRCLSAVEITHEKDANPIKDDGKPKSHKVSQK